jgi:ribosomal protein L40E
VATARPVESPVWVASSRDVVAAARPGVAATVGIHSCVSCGLSLSANARFCRRCGSRQG